MIKTEDLIGFMKNSIGIHGDLHNEYIWEILARLEELDRLRNRGKNNETSIEIDE